jgi:murein DD-endopeptidase MepM/ murein hydrolase activator NlpD
MIKRRIQVMNRLAFIRYRNMKLLRMFPVIFMLLYILGTDTQRLESKDLVIFSPPLQTGRVTARFGPMMHPYKKKMVKHTGIDIASARGTDVHAAAKGIVAETGSTQAAGNYIIIAHDSEYSTFYSHLEKILVTEQQTVSPEKVIGLVGSTGLSTAPHLHFEIRLAADPQNPEDFIDFSSIEK